MNQLPDVAAYRLELEGLRLQAWLDSRRALEAAQAARSRSEQAKHYKQYKRALDAAACAKLELYKNAAD